MLVFTVKPDATVTPREHTVVIGGRAHFTCQVLRGSEPLTITWKREDHDTLPDGSRANNDVLDFTSVEAGHSGIYICTVTNKWDSFNISATLNVQGKLFIYTHVVLLLEHYQIW